MRRRPLLVVGVSALVVGILLLALAFWPGRGGDSTASGSSPSASSTSGRSSTHPSSPPSSATSSAPSASDSGAPTTVAPSSEAPVPTSAVVATQGLRLAVPAMGLDTQLSSGGVGSDGRINPPSGTAMWVRGFDRVRPGGVGTAVVAGHVVYGGSPDVFARLTSVGLGDTITVTDGGTRTAFRVSRVEVVDKTVLTTDADVWGANSSSRRIVLVTCDDELGFRPDGHRKANLVVVADAT